MNQDDNTYTQEQDSTVIKYRKSSLSSTNGTCAEVTIDQDNTIHLRDNKDLSQRPLTFNADEWIAFIGGVKKGEFDIS